MLLTGIRKKTLKKKTLYFDSRWTGSDRHPAEKTSPQCADPPKSSGTDFGKIENCMKFMNDTCAWTPNKIKYGLPRYPALGTLTTSNPGLQAIGSWARQV